MKTEVSLVGASGQQMIKTALADGTEVLRPSKITIQGSEVVMARRTSCHR